MPKPKMLIKPTKTSKQKETNLKYMEVQKYTRKMGLVTGKWNAMDGNIDHLQKSKLITFEESFYRKEQHIHTSRGSSCVGSRRAKISFCRKAALSSKFNLASAATSWLSAVSARGLICPKKIKVKEISLVGLICPKPVTLQEARSLNSLPTVCSQSHGIDCIISSLVQLNYFYQPLWEPNHQQPLQHLHL